MLGFLFRGLTAQPDRGAALFEAITSTAREPHWYVEGKIPDTIDGRFRVLTTLTALALVRLENEGDQGNAASVALTERFIDVMESEHRELGLGDPTLGKTVRKLVGSLSKRVELWRGIFDDGEWERATHASLYKGEPSAGAILHSTGALRAFRDGLERVAADKLMEGRLA